MKIEPKFWNDKKQLPKSTYQHYKLLKTTLDEIAGAIIENHNQHGNIPVIEFRDILDLKLRRNEIDLSGNSFLRYYEKFIQTRKLRPNANENTLKKMGTTYNHLLNFANGKDIKFDDVNRIFREEFLRWSYSEPRNHSQNTAAKNIQMIIQAMRDSYRNNLHTNTIIEDPKFKVKRVKTSKIALTEDEVQRLYDFDFSKNLRLDKTRDLFLISCYSSLRISDFKRIEPDNLVMMDGDYYLNMITDKTKEEVYIPVNENLLTILKKYDYKSPILSDQRFNEYIKEVCREVGINSKVMKLYNKAGASITEFVDKSTLVSAHTGRRTWASFKYSQGFPILLLMQCTGHMKESTFLKYIGISKKEQAKALMRQMKERQSQIAQEAKVVNL